MGGRKHGASNYSCAQIATYWRVAFCQGQCWMLFCDLASFLASSLPLFVLSGQHVCRYFILCLSIMTEEVSLKGFLVLAEMNSGHVQSDHS